MKISCGLETSMNPLAVGLALAVQVAVASQPTAVIFDPLDFTTGPYLQPEQEKTRIIWEQQPQVPDEAAIVMKKETSSRMMEEEANKMQQKAATTAIAGKDRNLDSMLQSSEVAPVKPQPLVPQPQLEEKKKAAALALIGEAANAKASTKSLAARVVPDESDFLSRPVLNPQSNGLLQQQQHESKDPAVEFPRRIQAAPVPTTVAKAASTSSEVSRALPKAQLQKTKTTMASVMGKQQQQKTPRKLGGSIVPDEGQLLSPSVLSRQSIMAKQQQQQPEQALVGPNKLKAAPVPSVVAKAAATSSEVSRAPPKAQQQKTKTTMASVMGKQQPPKAPARKASAATAVVPDEGQLLSRTVLSRQSLMVKQPTQLVGPKIRASAPVPSVVAKAAATSSEVSRAPPKSQQQKTKTTMASVMGKQKALKTTTAVVVPDEGELISPFMLSAGRSSRRLVSQEMELSDPAFGFPNQIQAEQVPSIVARAALTSSEVSR